MELKLRYGSAAPPSPTASSSARLPRETCAQLRTLARSNGSLKERYTQGFDFDDVPTETSNAGVEKGAAKPFLASASPIDFSNVAART